MANALGITEITDSQSGKYATVNMAVKYLSALMTGARDIASAPPGSPVENGCYIIGPGGNSGAWSAFAAKDLVFYFGSTWYKLAPVEGLTLWVWDEDVHYVYNGTNWVSSGQAWTSPSASVSPSVSASLSASASVSPSSSASPSGA